MTDLRHEIEINDPYKIANRHLATSVTLAAGSLRAFREHVGDIQQEPIFRRLVKTITPFILLGGSAFFYDRHLKAKDHADLVMELERSPLK